MTSRLLFLLAFGWCSLANARMTPGPQLAQNDSQGLVTAFEQLGQAIESELKFLSENAKKCSDRLTPMGNSGNIVKEKIAELLQITGDAKTFVKCRYNSDANCGSFEKVEKELRMTVDVEMTKGYGKMVEAFEMSDKYPLCTAEYGEKFQKVYRQIQAFKRDFYIAAKVQTKNGTESSILRSAPVNKFAATRRTVTTAN